MDNPVVHCVANPASEIGENPLWHEEEKVLYWCDILRGRLYRYDPASQKTLLVRDGNAQRRALGGFTIERDGALLLFLGGGRIVGWFRGYESVVLDGVDRERASRFNDVLATEDGQVFCGTMSTDNQLGRVYLIGRDLSLQTVVESAGCPNGLAFSRDGQSLYFTDSFAYTISICDYRPGTPAISNGRVFLHTEKQSGFPDGLTVDSEDHLWSARWGGSCVTRISLDGREMMRIPLPVETIAPQMENWQERSSVWSSMSQASPNTGRISRKA